jgi:hypothetical protein
LWVRALLSLWNNIHVTPSLTELQLFPVPHFSTPLGLSARWLPCCTSTYERLVRDKESHPYYMLSYNHVWYIKSPVSTYKRLQL